MSLSTLADLVLFYGWLIIAACLGLWCVELLRPAGNRVRWFARWRRERAMMRDAKRAARDAVKLARVYDSRYGGMPG